MRKYMQIVRVRDVEMPKYQTKGAVAFDIAIAERVSMQSMRPMKIPTGIAVRVPDGFALQIVPRSSTPLRGIQVHTGTIDQDYTGEIHIIATSQNFQVIEAGTRLAQGILIPIATCTFREVDSLPMTQRGEGGFGSTGE